MAKVTSSNPFDLLGDADFDGEVQAPKVQQKKEKTPAAKSAAKPVAAQQPAPAKKADSKPARGPRAPVQGGNFEAPPSSQGRFESRDKKPARGRGNPRGRGRDFDRHSGTGRVDTQKAITQGWGDVTENLEETAKVETQEPKEGETPAPEVKSEPEDNQLTLEEYYAQQKAKKSESDKKAKAVRKANEGADDAKWKDTVALKKEDEDFFSAKTSTKTKKTKERATKTFVEIEQKFTEPSDRRNNDRRSPRGGARGGRGGERGPKQANTSRPIALTDQSAFPSLGAN